jgi:hypothetical protein
VCGFSKTIVNYLHQGGPSSFFPLGPRVNKHLLAFKKNAQFALPLATLLRRQITIPHEKLQVFPEATMKMTVSLK